MTRRFKREIKVSKDGVLDTSNRPNTSSDNYSYYVHSKERESYQHKKSAWDPSRSFTNQYEETIRNNIDSLTSYTNSNIDSKSVFGENVYGGQEFDIDKRILGSDDLGRMNITKEELDDFLIKRRKQNSSLLAPLFSSNSYTHLKVKILIIIAGLCIFGTLIVGAKTTKHSNYKHGNYQRGNYQEEKYYYNEYDF